MFQFINKNIIICKLFATLMLAFLIMLTPLTATAAATPTKLILNGLDITTELYPQTINGHIYLPLRALTEKMGAYVSYADQTVQLTYNDIVITLQLGSKMATITYPEKTQKNIVLNTPAYLWRNTTYVPLRFLAETIPGWQIDYDASQKTVNLDYAVGSQIEIDGKKFCYMTTENGFGMSRYRYLYSDIAPLYDALSSGKIREVTEPQTEYGATFTVYDYYALTDILYFYQKVPTSNDITADKALFCYELYHMYEGIPEFGKDSRNLLHDVNANKWYVFNEKEYRAALNRATSHLIFSSAA